MSFSIGDKVERIDGGSTATVVAVGVRGLFVNCNGADGLWNKDWCRVVTDPPPAPPKPVPPACGYWTYDGVLLHDPVWRYVNANNDYWIGCVRPEVICGHNNRPQELVNKECNGFRWCLSVLEPPKVPDCGYWEMEGRRYVLAKPMEYRLARKGDVYFSKIDHFPTNARGDHFLNDGPHWILREIPTVRRFIDGVYDVTGERCYGYAPLIDTGSGPRLDVDKIGREWAIRWFRSEGLNGAADRLQKEQEADNDHA